MSQNALGLIVKGLQLESVFQILVIVLFSHTYTHIHTLGEHWLFSTSKKFARADGQKL